MNRTTQDALRAINQAFYASAASRDFHVSRSTPWRGWAQVVDKMKSASSLSVLDAGCGNGRFARYLVDEGVVVDTYVGLEQSAQLLQYARQTRGENITFIRSDLEGDRWDERLGDIRFDWVVLWGVLHHIPSFDRRVDLLLRLVERSPSGQVACSCWRFLHLPRFQKRIVPWSEVIGVDEGELESGDALLRWGDRKGGALRYCHHFDEDELDRLENALLVHDVHLRCRYEVDGDFNAYLVFGKDKSISHGSDQFSVPE